MKVYIAFNGYDYEGDNLLGAFKTLEEAKERYEREEFKGDRGFITEVKLGYQTKNYLSADEEFNSWIKKGSWDWEVY